MSKIKTTSSPWSLTVKELIEAYETDLKGLSPQDSADRQSQFGKNLLVQRHHQHGLLLFLSQFANPLVIILVVAAIISYFLGELIDSIVIISIVTVSALLGFFQEYKAEKALRSLEKFITRQARVYRLGKLTDINAQDLVLGDIIELHNGDVVPADGRIISFEDLTLDESILTGESLPVEKNDRPIKALSPQVQDMKNMVFMGSSVSSGEAKVIVTGIAKNTFIGSTAVRLEEKDEIGEFQKSIQHFSNFLLKVILVMTLFIFGANAVLGKGFFDSFLFAVALAVGITPEVLPILMTITLSNGALKMAKEKVIVKRLSSVEDLGNIDTLCCDKTGTLTEGKLSLNKYLTTDGETDIDVFRYGLLCTPFTDNERNRIDDNPYDLALWEHPKARENRVEIKQFQIEDENEFDYHRRRVSVVVKHEDVLKFVSRGSAESILEICTEIWEKGKICKLDKGKRLELKQQIDDYERSGFRSIGVAYKNIDYENTTKDDEVNLTLKGFLLFQDPPKSSAKEALQLMQKLGVRIKIISGDSAVVTQKICHDVGFTIVEDRVITGDDLTQMSQDELSSTSEKYNVFARVTPEQKYKIVKSLNRDGHIVGFLGDGVNDAPALKAADVGISVNTGVEIAKEASDVILLKKSLSVLIRGIIEGRKIFSNITKYILNTISANFGNMFTVAGSSFFLNFIPLLPGQILLNNFISDLPMLAIATDSVDEDQLARPRRWNISFITKFMLYFGLISTIFDLLLILPLKFYFKVDEALFRTAWFVESSLSEIIVTFSIRTKNAFFKSRPSWSLIASSLLTVLVASVFPYTIWGRSWFSFVSMPGYILGFIGLILLGYFMTTEILKRYFFRKFEL